MMPRVTLMFFISSWKARTVASSTMSGDLSIRTSLGTRRAFRHFDWDSTPMI